MKRIVLNTQATSPGTYSRKAFEKLGFEVVTTVDYATFIDPRRERPFEKINPTHPVCTLMMKGIATL